MDANSIKQIIDALERNVPGAIDVLARAAYVKAWGDIFTTVAFAVFAACAAYASYRMCKAYDKHDEDWMAGVSVVVGVVGAVFAIATVVELCSVAQYVADIASPKAAAIRQLLGK